MPDQRRLGWLNRRWSNGRGIRGFNGQPIVFHGQVLGVWAIYTYIPTPEQSPAWAADFCGSYRGGTGQRAGF